MIRIDGPQLKDEHGRTLLLRGVNLGGSSKVPFAPNGATHIRSQFFEHRDVSFVGRPFPLEEADEHFARLREWGMTFLRLLVTWEAVEHAGPGLYDQAYLDYLVAVAQKANEHGIHLFIDPHQDVWSRFTGGDGAPGWTLEAVGFDLTHFKETGAAIVHATHGDPFPRMIWPTNGTKLAAATMFTLFFAGDDLAPQTKVNGEPVQEFLQRHYVQAIQQVALRLRDLPNVVGYDTFNEPLSGWIGCRDLDAIPGTLQIGDSPTPFQAMLLGAGYPQEVEVYELRTLGSRRTGVRVLNAERTRAWREGYDPVWQQNGVWDLASDGMPRLLRPDHFARVKGQAVDFQACYRSFANRFATAIRSADPDALIFVETEFAHLAPQWSAADAREIAYAPHWYDVFVLLRKDYHPWIAADMWTDRPVFGPRRIRRSLAGQVGIHKQSAHGQLGGVPVLLGEFGIPFDMQDKKAYHGGNFGRQIQAMDRTFRALEDNLLGGTLWNYTADNSNAHGDQWNGEDLSIFSRDQQTDPADIHSGGRALRAAVRPYPRATAGEPLHLSFDIRRRVFEFRFRHDPDATAPTEIFVPNIQYPGGYDVQASDGTYEVQREQQTLIYRHGVDRAEHTIRIKPLR